MSGKNSERLVDGERKAILMISRVSVANPDCNPVKYLYPVIYFLRLYKVRVSGVGVRGQVIKYA